MNFQPLSLLLLQQIPALVDTGALCTHHANVAPMQESDIKLASVAPYSIASIFSSRSIKSTSQGPIPISRRRANKRRLFRSTTSIDWAATPRRRPAAAIGTQTNRGTSSRCSRATNHRNLETKRSKNTTRQAR